MIAILSSRKNTIINDYKGLIIEELKRTDSSIKFNYEEINEKLVDSIFGIIDEYIITYCNLSRNEILFNSNFQEKGDDFLPPNFKIINVDNKEIEIDNCYEYLKSKLNTGYEDLQLIDIGKVLTLFNSPDNTLYRFPNRIKIYLDSKEEILRKINHLFIAHKNNYFIEIFNYIEDKVNEKERFDWITINHGVIDVKCFFTYNDNAEIIIGTIKRESSNNEKKHIYWNSINFKISNLDTIESDENKDYYSVTLINKRNERYNISIEKKKDTFNYIQKRSSGM